MMILHFLFPKCLMTWHATVSVHFLLILTKNCLCTDDLGQPLYARITSLLVISFSKSVKILWIQVIQHLIFECYAIQKKFRSPVWQASFCWFCFVIRSVVVVVVVVVAVVAVGKSSSLRSDPNLKWRRSRKTSERWSQKDPSNRACNHQLS